MERWPKYFFWDYFVRVEWSICRPFDFDTQASALPSTGIVCVSYIFVVKCNFSDDFNVKHLWNVPLCMEIQVKGAATVEPAWGAWGINSYAQTQSRNEITQFVALFS